ncbi:30S ribosomal protein S11, chloroplastic, partial [Cucurbita argyrosperma subsp. argyrosperma]
MFFGHVYSIKLVQYGYVPNIPPHVRGRVISWSSTRTCEFKSPRRGTPFATQTAAKNAIRAVEDQGIQQAEVMIKGSGLGRDAASRAIRRSGTLPS